jgi:hypothetical protein
VVGTHSYVLTLTTYADYIREHDQAVPKVGRGVADISTNVVDLEWRKSGNR